MKDYLWVIEEKTNGRGWEPWDTRPTRARARRSVFFLRKDDPTFKGKTRVVKYVRDEWSLRHPPFNRATKASLDELGKLVQSVELPKF